MRPLRGLRGVRGKTWHSGAGTPSNALGVDGDFFLNTATNSYHGPKAGGVWPSGVSLVGPVGPGATTVASAELAADVQGTGSSNGTVMTATFSHVAGRVYKIEYECSLRRSAAGVIVTGLASSLVTLPTNRFAGESVSGVNLPAGVGSYLLFVADSTGSSTITLTASAKAGGNSWFCFANTENTTLGAHARIMITERNT